MVEDQDIILGFYDSVIEPGHWPVALQRMTERVGGQGCIIFDVEEWGNTQAARTSHCNQAYAPDTLDRYMARFHDEEMSDQNVYVRHLLDRDDIDLVDDQALGLNPAPGEARPHQRHLQSLGIGRRLGGLLNRDNPRQSRFGMTFAADRKLLGEATRARISRLMPHLSKAVHLGQPAAQLARIQQGLLAAVDRLTIGLCVVDRAMNVIIRNTEFDRQCQDYDAFRIGHRGALEIGGSVDRARFTSLVRSVIEGGRYGARPRKEAVPIAKGSPADALCIEVAPLARCLELGTASFEGAVIYSMDTSRMADLDVAPLARLYGLTRTEAALAELMGEGLTNAEIAERRERSVDTVNAQVKSVLGKTMCTNRTQLVRLMTSFGGNFVIPEPAGGQVLYA